MDMLAIGVVVATCKVRPVVTSGTCKVRAVKWKHMFTDSCTVVNLGAWAVSMQSVMTMLKVRKKTQHSSGLVPP